MFENAAEIRAYTLAGKAILTLVSDKTGARYTFKVKQAKNRDSGAREDKWFVALLTGPDNESSYTYMGMLAGGAFRLTKASRYSADATPVRAFSFFWKFVVDARMPPQMTVEHAGHCGRCGRTLTVPASIRSGIGPECAKKVMGL